MFFYAEPTIGKQDNFIGQLTFGMLTDLSILKSETFILPRLSTGIGYVETILQICQSYGFRPNVAHESAHSIGVLRLVEAGLGIAIEPMSSFRGVTMKVKIIELKQIPQKVEMALFWLRDRQSALSRLLSIF